MLVFGIDIPLVEIIFTLALIMFILLVESVILIILMTKHMSKTKKISNLVQKLSDTILQIKKVEVQELDKIKRIR